VHRQKRLAQRHRSPAPAAWLAQPLAPQQIANGRGRRAPLFGILPLQDGAQLLRTLIGPPTPQRHDRRGDLVGHRHAMAVRRARARLQPTRPLFPIASQQPVASIAADAVALTENLSGIYPVHNVRYLSGSDPERPPHPSLSPNWGRGLRRVGEAEPSLTRSWVRGLPADVGISGLDLVSC
jgi:hypothetical protein